MAPTRSGLLTQSCCCTQVRMAAARRAAPAVLARLAEADSAAAGAQGQAVTVPFEVARLVSRRWLGLVELPATVRAAVATAVATARQTEQAATAGTAGTDKTSAAVGGGASARAGGGATTKQLRTSSLRLTDALRRRSRTEARGGVHERPELDPVSGRRQRPRQVNHLLCALVAESAARLCGAVFCMQSSGCNPIFLVPLHGLCPSDPTGECPGWQEAAAADRALPDFRRSSDILDLTALDTAADGDASSISTTRAQGLARGTDAGGLASPLGYDAVQVAGYAATRLPATYAVLIKVCT